MNNYLSWRRLYSSLFIFYILFVQVFADSAVDPREPKLKTVQERVAIAHVDISANLPKWIGGKIEPAIHLALSVGGKHSLVPTQSVDSAFQFLQSKNITPTTANMSTFLSFSKSIFYYVDRLENLLRVEIIEKYGKNLEQTRIGVGYSILKHRRGDSIIYDMSLLQATQRAFALAEADSFLYNKSEGAMRVFPAPPVVVCGVEFRDKYDNLNKLYDRKKQAVHAYDGIQAIFLAGKDHEKYTLVDSDTRDSIYTIARLTGVENNRPPSEIELRMLQRLGIRHCITAIAENKKDYSEITVQLFGINDDGTLYQIRGVKDMIETDKIEDFRKSLSRATSTLLDGKIRK